MLEPLDFSASYPILSGRKLMHSLASFTFNIISKRIKSNPGVKSLAISTM